jgi:peroxiredoxin family protein
MQKMVAAMDRPGIDHLKLGQMNFVGAGPKMMKHLAKEHRVASPGELLEAAVALGVNLVPCQMTMDLLGLRREDMIDGLGEPAGATTMLMEAQDAITLFI